MTRFETHIPDAATPAVPEIDLAAIDMLAIARAARADHDRAVFKLVSGWIAALFARNVGPRTNRARRRLSQDGLAGA